MRRVATHGRLLLPLALLVCALLPAPPAHSIASVEAAPVVTLGELASSSVTFDANDFARDGVFWLASSTYGFSLPPDASAAMDESWFLLELDYRIEFALALLRDSPGSLPTRTGLTGAQIEYVLSRDDGRLAVRESSVTLQDGQRERVLPELLAAVDYANYARFDGVVEGRNSLTLRVEHTPKVCASNASRSAKAPASH